MKHRTPCEPIYHDRQTHCHSGLAEKYNLQHTLVSSGSAWASHRHQLARRNRQLDSRMETTAAKSQMASLTLKFISWSLIILHIVMYLGKIYECCPFRCRVGQSLEQNLDTTIGAMENPTRHHLTIKIIKGKTFQHKSRHQHEHE